jgi:hypothetical protein
MPDQNARFWEKDALVDESKPSPAGNAGRFWERDALVPDPAPALTADPNFTDYADMPSRGPGGMAKYGRPFTPPKIPKPAPTPLIDPNDPRSAKLSAAAQAVTPEELKIERFNAMAQVPEQMRAQAINHPFHTNDDYARLVIAQRKANPAGVMGSPINQPGGSAPTPAQASNVSALMPPAPGVLEDIGTGLAASVRGTAAIVPRLTGLQAVAGQAIGQGLQLVPGLQDVGAAIEQQRRGDANQAFAASREVAGPQPQTFAGKATKFGADIAQMIFGGSVGRAVGEAVAPSMAGGAGAAPLFRIGGNGQVIGEVMGPAAQLGGKVGQEIGSAIGFVSSAVDSMYEQTGSPLAALGSGVLSYVSMHAGQKAADLIGQRAARGAMEKLGNLLGLEGKAAGELMAPDLAEAHRIIADHLGRAVVVGNWPLAKAVLSDLAGGAAQGVTQEELQRWGESLIRVAATDDTLGAALERELSATPESLAVGALGGAGGRVIGNLMTGVYQFGGTRGSPPPNPPKAEPEQSGKGPDAPMPPEPNAPADAPVPPGGPDVVARTPELTDQYATMKRPDLIRALRERTNTAGVKMPPVAGSSNDELRQHLRNLDGAASAPTGLAPEIPNGPQEGVQEVQPQAQAEQGQPAAPVDELGSAVQPGQDQRLLVQPPAVEAGGAPGLDLAGAGVGQAEGMQSKPADQAGAAMGGAGPTPEQTAAAGNNDNAPQTTEPGPLVNGNGPAKIDGGLGQPSEPAPQQVGEPLAGGERGLGERAAQGSSLDQSTPAEHQAIRQRFEAAGPGHVKISNQIDAMVADGTLDHDSAALIRATTEDMDDDFLLGRINLLSAMIPGGHTGQATTLDGKRAPTRNTDIALAKVKRGLAQTIASMMARGHAVGVDQMPAAVALQEIGHIMVRVVPNKAQTEQLRKAYAAGIGGWEKEFEADGFDPEAAKYAASSFDEWAAHKFVMHVLGHASKDPAVRGLMARLFQQFKRALKRLAESLGFVPDSLRPIFEAMRMAKVQPEESAAKKSRATKPKPAQSAPEPPAKAVERPSTPAVASEPTSPARGKLATNDEVAAAFYRPGTVVVRSGNADLVESFTPAEDGQPWSVTVRAVVRQGNEWVPQPGARSRVHATAPTPREAREVLEPQGWTIDRTGKAYKPAENAPPKAAPAPAPPPLPTERPAALVQQQTQRPDPEPMTRVENGRTAMLELPDGRSLPVQYRMVEASELTPSHDARRFFRKNPAGDANERPYEDREQGGPSRDAVTRIAENPKPHLILTDTPTATDGPPIVDHKGRVLGGNARTMAMQLAYDQIPSSAEKYRAAMLEAAPRFGIDVAKAMEFRQPVIVRALSESDAGGPGEMSRILNQSHTAGRTAVADAISRGKLIDSDTASLITAAIEDRTLSEALASDATSAKVVAALVQSGAWSKADLAAYMEGGSLNREGKLVIERSLLGSILPDVAALSEATPSTRQLLIRAAAPMIRLRKAMSKADSDVSFDATLTGAMEVMAKRRAMGAKTVDELMAETLAPEGALADPRAVALAKALDGAKPTEFAETMNRVADAVVEAQAGQVSMKLGRPPSAGEAFDDAMRGDVGGLFSRPDQPVDMATKGSPDRKAWADEVRDNRRRLQERRDFVRSRLGPDGGQIPHPDGRVSVIHRNPDNATREKYPWRVTSFARDMRPWGHTLHTSLDGGQDSAVDELARFYSVGGDAKLTGRSLFGDDGQPDIPLVSVRHISTPNGPRFELFEVSSGAPASRPYESMEFARRERDKLNEARRLKAQEDALEQQRRLRDHKDVANLRLDADEPRRPGESAEDYLLRRKSREAEKNTGFLFGRPLAPDSQAFRDWFGDSKIVDDEGKPLVMYHGTQSGGFNEFRDDKMGVNLRHGPGFYFTDSPVVAGGGTVQTADGPAELRGYAEPERGGSASVMPVYLSVQNPMLVDDPAAVRGMLERVLPADNPRVANLNDPDSFENKTLASAPARYLRSALGSVEATNEAIRAAGYDGIVYSSRMGEETSRNVVVFRSEQVKSAIGNAGTYRRDSKNILFGRALDKVNQDELGFTSRLEAWVNDKLRGPMPAGQIRLALKNAGLPADEIKWTGLDQWLADKKGEKVTPADVKTYLDANRVVLKETTLGGDSNNADLADLVQKRDAATQKARRILNQFDARETADNELDWQISKTARYLALHPNAPDERKHSAIEGAIEAMRRPYAEDVYTEMERRGLFAAMREAIETSAAAERLLLTDEPNDAPKFEQFTLPGGSSYREVLLTLPPPNIPVQYPKALTELPPGYELIEDSSKPAHARWGVTPPGQTHARPFAGSWISPERAKSEAIARLNDDAYAKAEQARRDAVDSRTFKSGHFAELNIIAHLRIKDRITPDNRRVLFLEEVQSDWHEAGRDRGYSDPAEAARLQSQLDNARRQLNVLSLDDPAAIPLTAERDRLHAALTKAERGVPAAPWSKNWHEMALRRAIRLAAEGGYDALGWTTGRTQIARYELGNAVEKIEWERLDGGVKKVYIATSRNDGVDFEIKDGKVFNAMGQYAGDLGGKELREVVGADLARKINDNENGSVAGGDIRIGGGGMQSFYDRDLPNYARKYAKGWGAEPTLGEVMTGQTDHPSGDPSRQKGEASEPAHLLPITDAMRDSVLKGQPLFGRSLFDKDDDQPAPSMQGGLFAAGAKGSMVPGAKPELERPIKSGQAAGGTFALTGPAAGSGALFDAPGKPAQPPKQSFRDKYPGVVVAFRNGDHYELRGEDAKTVNAKTGMPIKDGVVRVPVDGIELALRKIIAAGVRVALAEPRPDGEPAKSVEAMPGDRLGAVTNPTRSLSDPEDPNTPASDHAYLMGQGDSIDGLDPQPPNEAVRDDYMSGYFDGLWEATGPITPTQLAVFRHALPQRDRAILVATSFQGETDRLFKLAKNGATDADIAKAVRRSLGGTSGNDFGEIRGRKLYIGRAGPQQEVLTQPKIIAELRRIFHIGQPTKAADRINAPDREQETPVEAPNPETAPQRPIIKPAETGFPGQQLGLLGDRYSGGITGGQPALFETRPDVASPIQRAESQRVAEPSEAFKDRETGGLFGSSKLKADVTAGPASMSLDDFEAAGFQPWQITKAEWVAMQRRHRRSLGQNEDDGTAAAPNAAYEEYHRDMVKAAKARGLDVPKEVLKDYPETLPKLVAVDPNTVGTTRAEIDAAVPHVRKGKRGWFTDSFPDPVDTKSEALARWITLDRINRARQAGGAAYEPGTGYNAVSREQVDEALRAPVPVNKGRSGENSIGQRRAKEGGEYGPNGEFYPGGSFINTVPENPKGVGGPSGGPSVVQERFTAEGNDTSAGSPYVIRDHLTGKKQGGYTSMESAERAAKAANADPSIVTGSEGLRVTDAREIARQIGHPNSDTIRQEIADAIAFRGPWRIYEYLKRQVGGVEAEAVINRVLAQRESAQLAPIDAQPAPSENASQQPAAAVDRPLSIYPPPVRRAAIDAIVKAAQQPTLPVVEVFELQGTDGKWYRANGFPVGVRHTGERRSVGFVQSREGVYVGTTYKTHAEAINAQTERQARDDADLRGALEEQDDDRLRQQAEFWLDKKGLTNPLAVYDQKQAPAAPSGDKPSPIMQAAAELQRTLNNRYRGRSIKVGWNKDAGFFVSGPADLDAPETWSTLRVYANQSRRDWVTPETKALDAMGRDAKAAPSEPTAQPMPAADEFLKSVGITVTPKTLKGGRIVHEVTGNTYEHQDAIKSIPDNRPKWYGPTKTWTYWNGDPTQQLAAAISRVGVPRPADEPATGGTTDERVEIENRRRAELDRPDERPTGGDAAGAVERSTADLIRLGAKAGIPADVLDSQIEDIGLIRKAYEAGKRLFIVGSAPGSGKTYVNGGAIRELREAGATKFVWFTMNRTLIDQIGDDLKAYGLEGVRFATYSELSGVGKGNDAIDADGAVLIFDEAHNIKNVGEEGADGTKRATAAATLMKAARFVVFSSATPFENPVQARYLEPTGIFDSVGGHTQWAILFGAQAVKKKVAVEWGSEGSRFGKKEIVVARWVNTDQAEELARGAKRWFEKQGMMSQRALKLPENMVTANFERHDVPDNYLSLYKKVMEAYAVAESQWLDDQGKPLDPATHALVKMHGQNAGKRLLEAAKADQAVVRAKELIAAGKKVVIFVETKADRALGKFRESRKPNGPRYDYPTMARMMEEWRAEREAMRAARDYDRVPPPFHAAIMSIAKAMHDAGLGDAELPSVTDDIMRQIPSAYLFTGENTDRVNKDNLVKWRADKAGVLLATMAKGGTGLSLHDKKGDHPTAMLLMNMPWTATQLEQVLGRINRYGLASVAENYVLFSSNIPFERLLATRIGQRMRSMSATVKGIKSKAGKALVNFDFDSNYSAKHMLLTDEQVDRELDGQSEVDRFDQAGAMEKTRLQKPDKDMDYFATPYTVAALMADAAGVKAGDSVLEPSAGEGNLLRFLPAGVNATILEPHEGRRKVATGVAQAANLDLVAQTGRFEDYTGGPFDAVVMNPPFSRVAGKGWQDITHIQRAYSMLKPNGRLVAILSEGPFFRSDNQSAGFRDWLEQVGATVVRLPEGTFKNSGTSVRARMIVVDRQGNEYQDLELGSIEPDDCRAMAEAIPTRPLMGRPLGDGDQTTDSDIPPDDEAAYVPLTETLRAHRGTYFDNPAGTFEQPGNTRKTDPATGQPLSSRTTPSQHTQYPVGTWRIDDTLNSIYGREVSQLRNVPLSMIQLTENDYTQPQSGWADPENRRADAERYSEWMRSGQVPPPVTIVERDDGALRLIDGHRRVAAAKMAGLTTIPAWVSPRMLNGQRTSDGRPMYAATGMTYEGMKYGPAEANRRFEERQRALLERRAQENTTLFGRPLNDENLPEDQKPGTAASVSTAIDAMMTAPPSAPISAAMRYLSGHSAPKTAALSERAANALVAFATARTAAPRRAAWFRSLVLGAAEGDEAMRRRIGAVWVETTLQATRTGFLERAAEADTPEEAAMWQERYDRATPTLIGLEGFPIQTAEDFEKAKADPIVRDATQAWIRHAMPYLNNRYRLIKGDPEAEVPYPDPETGFFVSMWAAPKDDEDATTPSRPSSNQPFRKRSAEKSITRTATGQRYETDAAAIIDNSVAGRDYLEAAKRRMYAVLKDEGLAIEAPPGQMFRDAEGDESRRPTFNGQPGVMLAETVRRGRMPRFQGDPITEVVQLWVDPRIANEVRRAGLRNDELDGHFFTQVTNALTAIQVYGILDLTAHGTNIIRALAMSADVTHGSAGARSGRAIPLARYGEAFVRIGRAMAKRWDDSPEIRRQIMELAEIGAMRPDAHRGHLPGVLEKALDNHPRIKRVAETVAGDWQSKLLRLLDEAGRLAMDNLYEDAVRAGVVKGTDMDRREWNNMLGQYEGRLMDPLKAFFRKAQLAPFVVAGTAFNRNSVRALIGTSAATAPTSKRAIASSIARILGGVVGCVLLAFLANWLLSGKPMGRAGVPVGAVDLGLTDSRGRPYFLDLMAMTGMRRGARLSGLNALANGLRYGRTAGDITDDAMLDALGWLHPYTGPAVTAALMALTGRGIHPAERAPVVGPHQSQRLANLLTALEELNPMVKAFVEGKTDGGVPGGIRNAVIKPLLNVVGIGSATPPDDKARAGAERREFVEWLAGEARKMPRSQRMNFVREHINEIADPNERARALKDILTKHRIMANP